MHKPEFQIGNSGLLYGAVKILWGGKPMKHFIVRIISSLLLTFLMATYAAAQTKTFTGEITDEHLNCIQTPMKAAAGVDTKAGCVLYWAKYQKPASKYVLYDAATKMTYQLDDQNGAEPFAGEMVVVTGTESGGAIKMANIKIDEKAYKAKSGQ
jgi:hypothetical protein